MAFLSNYFNGLIIGIGTMIPGVSGGTAAVLLGVFEEILEAVGSIFSHTKKSFIYLLPILSGAISGILLIAKPLELFALSMPSVSKLTYCVLSLVSTMLFVKKSITRKFNTKSAFSLLSGAISAALISVSIYFISFDFSHSNFFILLCVSLPLALALVLPAISFSYMLYFFGLHEKTLWAISNFDIMFLFPIFLGVTIGGLLFSKLLLSLINKYPQETYSYVLGFVLCSIVDILV